MSEFGENIKLSLFGESHAKEVCAILTGIPAGESIDMQELNMLLQRRVPGRFAWSTARKEADEPVFSSGVINEKTNDEPIHITVENKDAKSADYEIIKNTPRPGHADYTARLKYGADVDMRGGGKFSGRLTVPICVAGGICLQILQRKGIYIGAHLLQIGDVKDDSYIKQVKLTREELQKVKGVDFPTINQSAGTAMQQVIERVKTEGDSVGGIIECAVLGIPKGIGGPYFEGVEGALAKALFAIPAVKGVSFGAGFGVASMKGSENNDAFVIQNSEVQTLTNNSGGILGGITTGVPLIVNVAVKPTPSIAKAQKTVNLTTMKEEEIQITGRHDPCVAPRAVPVVEAVVGLVVLDLLIGEGA